MDDQVTQINELFAAPKGNLSVAVDYGSFKVYTSPTLKKNFLMAMAKTSRVKPVANTIAKLMMQNEFIPCYLTDKVYKALLKKQPPGLKGTVGQTVGNLILVYVDNDTNIFGFATNDKLSITALHELIHKASRKFPSFFLQSFKTELSLFYSYYLNTIFSIKKGEMNLKEVNELVKFLYNRGINPRGSNKFLIEYHKRLTEMFRDKTTLDDITFQKLVNQFIVMIKIIWKGELGMNPTLVERAVFANKQLISPLYYAYKAVFGINIKHIKEMCYQELFEPSEVISLPALAKRPSPKIYKLVNKL